MTSGNLHVDRAEALRYLGYAGQVLDEDLAMRFDDAVEACERGVVPRCAHASFALDPARSQEGRLALKGCGLVMEGSTIARHLEGACGVVLMACTLGEACERELRRRVATSPTDALLYDAAASALVEAAADAEEACIVEEAAALGLHANFRYSPGYGDFPLAAQPALLAALQAPARLGLASTESHLLVPSKSVTAVVGLFVGDPPHTPVLAACEACTMQDRCAFKSQGGTCHG
ncbi:MAG: vitamin B12 dependent methionine synthase [Gordonibacter sp.]|uniref:vitamin B12 dependent methionine synthase n=1 Tax=Gordonibacter sp. TaxID=1968902 RepID=UPI002FC80757